MSTECDYPLGVDKSNTITDEWAVSQVKSSVDYSHGNWLTTFLCGALNYQVTHHLFPTVSQVRGTRGEWDGVWESGILGRGVDSI